MTPNKSLEPSAVPSSRSFDAQADGDVSPNVAVHATSRRWISFKPMRILSYMLAVVNFPSAFFLTYIMLIDPFMPCENRIDVTRDCGESGSTAPNPLSEGLFSFHGCGYRQFTRRKAVHTHSQSFPLTERGGLSFDRTTYEQTDREQAVPPNA